MNNSKGVQELLKEWRLPQIAVSNIKRAATVEEDSDKDTRENVKLKLDASTLILKLSGDLKERTVNETTIHATLHTASDEELEKIVEKYGIDDTKGTTELGTNKTKTA